MRFWHERRFRRIRGMTLLVAAFAGAACATRPVERSNRYPIPLPAAVDFLAESLYPAVQRRGGPAAEAVPQVVLDPFLAPETGEVLRVSRRIERRLIDAADSDLRVRRMTPASLREADYALNGRIVRSAYPVPGTPEAALHWRLRAQLVDLGNGAVVGRAGAWVSDRDLDVRPIPLHADSPVFFNNLPQGPRSGPEYVDGLQAAALLAEAEARYGEGDFAGALERLRRIVAADAGPLMKVWSGIYSAHRQLGHTEAMIRAFDRLIDVSVERYRQLTIKFLFQVNSTEFWADPELRRQYALWLERLGRHFRNHPDVCLLIEGHCSRTGPETFNARLSLERALRIRNLLKPHFPAVASRSRVVGRGFSETILGIGTDDARDLIDRRVAFEIIDCDTVTQRRTP
jgi:outer membrane protein OmpA-like peptidoglycan-associated protein